MQPLTDISPEGFNLQKSKLDLFQIIVSSMAEGVFLVRVIDGHIVYANTNFEKIFGYDSGELKDKPIAILNFDAITYAQISKVTIAQFNNCGESTVEVKRVKKDGTPFWSRSRITQFDHPEFGLVWVSVVEDITLRKEAEESTRKSVVKRALRKERNRISLELHDELGQTLTILKMDLFDLNKNPVSAKSSPSDNRIVEMGSSVDQLIKKVRTIALDLRPSILENYGLEEGIKYLVNDLKSRTGKVMNLDISLEGVAVDRQIATALFRILQEALTNTLRHSNSEKIDISLQKTEIGFTLLIRDYNDTKSISFQSLENSLGIIGMKERTNILGGEFSIKNVGGVIVRVDIPGMVQS